MLTHRESFKKYNILHYHAKSMRTNKQNKQTRLSAKIRKSATTDSRDLLTLLKKVRKNVLYGILNKTRISLQQNKHYDL